MSPRGGPRGQRHGRGIGQEKGGPAGERGEDGAHHPPRSAHGAREHGLQPAAGLLLPHAQQDLHCVDGDGDAAHDDQRREPGVEHLAGAVHALVHLLCAPAHLPRALAHRAEDEPEADEGDEPAEEGRTLQAPGQAERPSECDGGAGAAHPLREDAGAEIATDREPAGDGDQQAGEARGQGEQPPVFAAERAQLIAPAYRREPAGPGAGDHGPAGVHAAEHVADAADEERHGEGGHREPVGAASRPRELRRDRGDPGERDADAGDGGAGGERAGRRLSAGDHREAEQRRQHEVRAEGHDDSRCQARGGPDDAGADELGPARLFVLPRVPHHAEHAHDGGEHGEGDERPAHRVGAHAGTRREAQQAEAGVARHEARLAQDVGLGGKVVREHGSEHRQQSGQQQHPGREHEAVAAHRQADEACGPGEGAHATRSRLVSSSVRVVPCSV